MKQFDLMNLLVPLLLAGKLMLRGLYGEAYKGDWDDSFPTQLQALWYDYIKAALSLDEVKFPRSVAPEDGGKGLVNSILEQFFGCLCNMHIFEMEM